MSDLPIIMSAPMVRALLREAEAPGSGKTMTRRLAWRTHVGSVTINEGARPSPWQRAKTGDRLWVRESIKCFNRATAQYVADITPVAAVAAVDRTVDGRAKWVWKQTKLPSIHMPRWASRLTLIVTATKIERLQEITINDVKAEGLVRRATFQWLWTSLHGLDGPASWRANPEVVALTFTVHQTNIDAMPKDIAA